MGHVRLIRNFQHSGCFRLIVLLRDAFEKNMREPDGEADMKEFCRGRAAVRTKRTLTLNSRNSRKNLICAKFLRELCLCFFVNVLFFSLITSTIHSISSCPINSLDFTWSMNWTWPTLHLTLLCFINTKKIVSTTCKRRCSETLAINLFMGTCGKTTWWGQQNFQQHLRDYSKFPLSVFYCDI